MSVAVFKTFRQLPRVLGDGAVEVFDARGMAQLTVITGAGCTVTVSRVDTNDATEHTTGTENQFSVAASTRTATAVDWPFYRVSASGGTARAAMV